MVVSEDSNRKPSNKLLRDLAISDWTSLPNEAIAWTPQIGAPLKKAALVLLPATWCGLVSVQAPDGLTPELTENHRDQHRHPRNQL
jgi:hypothetical protein